MVPAFAKDFPSDPRLDRIVALFEQGNYAAVRKDAEALLKDTDDEKVRAAAKVVLERLKPDPLALYLVAIAGLLLALLAGWYWTHPHEIPPSPPPSINPAPSPVPMWT